MRSAAPTRAAAEPLPGSAVPRLLTPFLGRAEEARRVRALLEQGRLLTIVGPGGVGKTRLLLHVAHTVNEQYPDGAHFVSLESLSSPDEVAAAIADGLRLVLDSGAPPDVQLRTYLRPRRALLALDGFERLLAAATLLTELLCDAPGLRILVSSRERLNVYGEIAYELAGMTCEPAERRPGDGDGAGPAQLPHSDAVELFLAGAARAGAPVDRIGADLAHVARICRLVDGLPLAVELAASWTKLLPCEEIARRIERGLDLPSAALRDLPERHRSLRAVCEHSWQLLDDRERAAARRLSAFCGAIALDAADRVAHAPLDLLASLRDKSILRSDTTGRVVMHAILRQYAADQLARLPDDFAATRARHCAYYLDFLVRREAAIAGPDQPEVLREIAAELDNVRAAWRWAAEHRDFDALARCAETMFRFHEIRGWFRAGHDLLADAAARCADAAATGPADATAAARRALYRLRARQGAIARRQGRFEAAEDLVRESLDGARAADDGAEVSYCLSTLAGVLIDRGDHDQALAVADEAGRVLSVLPYPAPTGAAWTAEVDLLRQLGNLAFARGDYAGARRWYGRCLDRSRALGDRNNTATALAYLGAAAYLADDYDGALARCRQAMDLFVEVRNGRGQSRLLAQLADTHSRLGDHARALACARDAVDLARAGHMVRDEGVALGVSGVLCDRVGDSERAAAHIEAALAILVDIGDRLFGPWTVVYLALARHHLGDHDAARADCARVLQVATVMDAGHVAECAAIVCGHALHALGELDQAADAYRRALRADGQTPRPAAAAEARAGLARVALDRGELRRAAEHAEALRPLLDGRVLRATLEPFRVHETCWRALRAVRHPDAPAVLAAARARLLDDAGSLDGDARRRFLAVPHRRALVDAAAEVTADAGDTGPAGEVRRAGETGRAGQLVPDAPLVEPLSKRELEVLRCVTDGLANHDIAARLFISVHTVKRHISNIFAKLSVRSRTQAIARGRALGLLPAD